MRKVLLLVCGFFVATMADCQTVIDSFEVGPYDVEYFGTGDVNYSIRKDVDLYEYFGLEKDTIIIGNVPLSQIGKAYEVGVSYSFPRVYSVGEFNSLGFNGAIKKAIGKNLYLNYGAKIAFSFGRYNSGTREDALFELGIPVSIEFSKLSHNICPVYLSLGLTPAFYSTLSAKEKLNGTETDVEKKSGLYIAPKFEVGGYIPVSEHFLKIGAFAEYRKCLAKEEDDIFRHGIGCAYIGINFGYVF